MISLLKNKFGLSDAQVIILLDALLTGRRRKYITFAITYLLSDYVNEENFAAKGTGYYLGAISKALWDEGCTDTRREYIEYGQPDKDAP